MEQDPQTRCVRYLQKVNLLFLTSQTKALHALLTQMNETVEEKREWLKEHDIAG